MKLTDDQLDEIRKRVKVGLRQALNESNSHSNQFVFDAAALLKHIEAVRADRQKEQPS